MWFSTVLSAFGDGFRYSALPLILTFQGASPVILGLLMAAGTVPFVIFGLVGGSIVDRFDRVVVLRVTELVRAITVGFLAICLAMDLPSQVIIVCAFTTAVIMGSGESLSFPALFALTPTIVRESELPKFNSRLAAGQTIGRDFLGPLFGAAMVEAVSPAPFVIDAVTFLGAWVLLAALRPIERERISTRNPVIVQSLWRDALDGMHWMRSQGVLLRLSIASAVINVGNMGFLATEALHVIDVLNEPASAYGLMMAAAATGATVGAMILDRKIDSLPSIYALIPFAVLTVALGMAGLAVAPNLVIALLSSGVVGVGFAFYNILVVTSRQQLTPDEWRGRADALHRLISWGALPIGSLAGGLIGQTLGLRWPAILTVIFCLTAAFIVLTGRPMMNSSVHTEP